jgi:hypothetical protein
MRVKGLVATSVLALAGITLLPAATGVSAPTGMAMPATQKRATSQLRPKTGSGIRPCPRRPVVNYMAAEFLQCWFEAPHGRWRTLNHEFHDTVLVVEVEAASLDDAHEITARWVNVHRGMFSEILVYVQAESAPGTSIIRRVQWTRTNGYATLEYAGALRR